MKWNITNVRVRNTRYISPPTAMHTRESSIHNILYTILVFILYKNKSVNFRSLQFDLLRSSTTLVIQIYAQKTHADNVSVHKPT